MPCQILAPECTSSVANAAVASPAALKVHTSSVSDDGVAPAFLTPLSPVELRLPTQDFSAVARLLSISGQRI